MQPLGIFGGTFDPIHCGHLRTAFELWQELRLEEVRLLPAGTPPHREQLYASAEMRLQMVRAAVAEQSHFVLYDREVSRTVLSYWVGTLSELRPGKPAALAVPAARHGRLLGLPQWRRWRDLLTLAMMW
jgi:nicotinate-nucleotide adenylyltransferase